MALQVVAMGGYEIPGPSGPPSELEPFLFAAAGMAEPRVCCLATASGDAADFVARFYEVCDALPCVASHLALFHDRCTTVSVGSPAAFVRTRSNPAGSSRTPSPFVTDRCRQAGRSTTVPRCTSSTAASNA